MVDILELRKISKKFPGVMANDGVDLKIRQGEIHAIIGENGAGKSTLMNILYGLVKPSSGEILFKGRPQTFSSPLDAIACGIGMVHQHFMLVPSFTVWENIMLGIEPRKNKFFIDEKLGLESLEELIEAYGLEVDPLAKVESLSVGVQQRVEILKALYKGADILILDEPTAVLSPQETEELFQVIRGLVRDQGKTVIIITHKLKEVMDLSDRVSVMRQGRMVASSLTKDLDEGTLAEMMVGRELIIKELYREEIKDKDPILEVKNLYVRNKLGRLGVRGLDLSLRPGEVLGIAGVEGNGQSELVEALTGMSEIVQGDLYIKGERVGDISPFEIRKRGLAHVPEDRLRMGLAREVTLRENILMGSQRKKKYMGPLNFLRKNQARKLATRLMEDFDIRAFSEEEILGNLSGGNMQKLVIAREFNFKTPILVIAQPTRGVDIGAIEFIHKEIINKRNEGVAILLVSAELDEIFRLSDRIVTMYEGRITGEFKPGEISRKEIGLYMTGKKLGGGQDEIIY